MALARSFRDLNVYRLAQDAAQKIFQISKEFPPEEKYPLTDQVRRASRSVSANIAEAWRKRRYVAAFISKLSDADGEAAETQAWLDSALACQYITQQQQTDLDARYHHICAQLCNMMNDAPRWCLSQTSIQKPGASPARGQA